MKYADILSDYKKYKWFYTSSGKLVIGGKSSSQNEELLKKIKSLNKNFVVMHTSSPGSPFSVILSDIKEATKRDKEECAVFTACFSKAWKSGAKRAKVHSFESDSLYKSKNMKEGTWGISGKVDSFIIPLKLVLTIQKGVLRAVPESSVINKKDILLKITPGKIDKIDLLPKLNIELGDKFSQSEILQALPAGGLSIVK